MILWYLNTPSNTKEPGRNELLEDRRVQGRGQVEGLNLGGHGGEEEGEGGQPPHGQALGLGEAFASALGQIGRRGEAVQARPHCGEPRGDALDRLCWSGLRIVRVIQETEFADPFTGLGLSGLRAGELGFGRAATTRASA